MSDDDKHNWIAILQAAGMAEAAKQPLDVAALAAELGMGEQTVHCEIEQLEAAGLLLAGQRGEWPILLTAGRQFLTVEGVPWEVLHFLPSVIDDLHAREALIQAGVVLVDEFRYQHLHGERRRARQRACTGRVRRGGRRSTRFRPLCGGRCADGAAVGRPSSGLRCGGDPRCGSHGATALRLEMRADDGELTGDEASAAREELRGLFELFEDDDVLNMFAMQEPADAAVAGHDPINVQMGVADQRVESCFAPFGGTTPTGYISER